MLQITVPVTSGAALSGSNPSGASYSGGNSLPMAVLTDAEGDGGGGAVRMNSHIRILNDANQNQQNQQTQNNRNNNSTSDSQSNANTNSVQAYNVIVPQNVTPGSTFPVNVNGQIMQVQCPMTARPGMTLRISVPRNSNTTANISNNNNTSNIQSATDLNRAPDSSSTSNHHHTPNTRTMQQVFEVTVPPGIQPNQPFALLASGQRVLVTCPPNARPGQRIRFTLPVTVHDDPSNNQTNSRINDNSKQEIVSLKYDTKDGWSRSIRISDFKFQWVRMDGKGNIMDTASSNNTTHNIDKSAFVRKIQFLEGNDKRMRTARVSLVSASEAVVDSYVSKEVTSSDPNKTTERVVEYGELSLIQQEPMDKKVQWFLGICKKLQIPWDQGHLRIVVRRSTLFEDSVEAIMSLGRDDLRKIWRFDFMGEEGIDAGGLTKEWFLLVTKEVFDADKGLWLSSRSNQMSMIINPTSEATQEDHKIYFRFLGRVMGKALFEGQIISGHLVQYLYKHLLGWPVDFNDLENLDPELYQNMQKLLSMKADDIECLEMDFTTTEDRLGEKVNIPLVPGGADKLLTGENLQEYIEAYIKHMLFDRIRPQITELLLGFYDVIPEPLLTIFDFQELELIMCGLPNIDLADWKSHTLYTGYFQREKEKNQICKWFWDIVQDFDQEMKARLLQFVTGTSGVPSRGFSVLQGSDGNIKLFTIHGIDLQTAAYPRAHTCFNRLDLPNYKSKKDLKEKLTTAVLTCSTGFSIE
jgi:E3 ubiquitin-protein ligase NEDD4